MEASPSFDRDAWDAQTARASRRRTARSILIVAAVLFALFYVARVGWLFMWADEGDVPPLSSVPLPDGAAVLNETVGCGSGGCSVVFLVRPPEGQSAEELATQMGATPQLSVPGNLWDPRTVWLWAEPAAGALKITADYTSSEWVP
ncbi:hypothetical protein [Microbacterium sp. nov. GSS16]|uniref:hypothetical protein n=1 Tax=Microbacterium sp. nov. GSS16 TaxID=3019890 RepID=UPI002305334B|nr:hypothetical protein [Microbacterium sp. nov. GSS16]WCD91459.1 hypothetical protein PGB26_07015 [Microbacterium sp. nov. GSS16]